MGASTSLLAKLVVSLLRQRWGSKSRTEPFINGLVNVLRSIEAVDQTLTEGHDQAVQALIEQFQEDE